MSKLNQHKYHITLVQNTNINKSKIIINHACRLIQNQREFQRRIQQVTIFFYWRLNGEENQSERDGEKRCG